MTLLDADARAQAVADANRPGRITGLLRMMLRIRAFEETALARTRAGDIVGALHPYTGHEAIAAGVGEALRPDVEVVSYYRCHGHALAAGLDPTAMFAELFGRATGVNRGKGGSMHLAQRARRFLGGNSIVGANVAIAAGIAAAAQVRGTGPVVVFFGDGALGAGVVLETLRIAQRQALPMLFVCENNGYQDRTASPIVSDLAPGQVAAGLGVTSVDVDGNDARAVADQARDLLGAVRDGSGPRFLEARTYLRDFHCQYGPGTPDEYRPAEEVAAWRARDPIDRAARELPAGEVADLRAGAYEEMGRAARCAAAEPLPAPEDAGRDVTVARWRP